MTKLKVLTEIKAGVKGILLQSFYLDFRRILNEHDTCRRQKLGHRKG